MPVVRIPTVLRKHTGGDAKVSVHGATVGEAFDELVSGNPELKEQLFEGEELRGFVNVYVDDEDIRFIEGLDTPVGQDDEIAIMPAVAGGSGHTDGTDVAERPSTDGAAEPTAG